jgi:hypothetical protein
MNVERQAQALLDLVEADRRQKCAAILDDAERRRTAVLRQAHADARARMRNAIEEERLRRDARVGAARADLQTRRRLALQRRAAALLTAGWAKLPDELLRRWRSPEQRQGWVAAVVASARRALPAAAWRIAHEPDWPAAERDALAADVAAAAGTTCLFTADPRIRAGLVIAADGNTIDGTAKGLLVDRAEIGSLLLHLLDLGAET